MEKVCIMFTHAPYGSVQSFEGLRVAIGLSSMGCDEDLGLFFFDEALLCLTKNHKTDALNVSDIKSLLLPLLDMDAKVFACKSCMDRFGIKKVDLEPSVDIILVDEIVELLDQYDSVLRF